MNRWWVPPWRVRPAVVEEPDQGSDDLIAGLDRVEAAALRAHLERVSKQRDNALARGDVAELGQRNALADLEAATKKLAELQAYVVQLENRAPDDVAQELKRQRDQHAANCQALTDQLKEQRDANQLLELERLWEMNRAFVDPVGAEKVRGAK